MLFSDIYGNNNRILMKELYYTLLTLYHGKTSNLIKIVSLTLGLFVGILLFARIAYEYSWNTAYDDPSTLAIVKCRYVGTQQGKIDDNRWIVGPVAAAIMENFPDEVVSATAIGFTGNQTFRLGEKEFKPMTEVVDTLFFRTMGMNITSGQASDLAAPDVMFVSDELAWQIFGTTDVIGRTLIRNGAEEFTVRGTFAAVGNNNYVWPHAVMSMASLLKYKWRHFGWDGGDSYEGYIRLKSPASLERINSRIDAVVEKYVPYDVEKYGFGRRYYLKNLVDEHRSNPVVKRIVTNYAFLGVVILLIAALNYVLIVISGLSRRAKGIGVHKTNGATNHQVFAMFLRETGILLLISVGLVVFLILNLRDLIQDLIDVSLQDLFTWNILWVPAVIVLLVFLLAGFIPGRILSRIPVSQIFRRYTERNARWKQVLLFTQFTCTAFIFGVLVVLFLQYQQLLNYDLGYNVKNIVTAQVGKSKDVVSSMIKNLPMVEDISFSLQGIGIGYSGKAVEDGERMLFSTRYNSIDENFVPLYDIHIAQGRNIQAPGEVLVNRIYVNLMPWDGEALGKPSSNGDSSFGIVVGVIDDIVDNGLFAEKKPLVLANVPKWNNMINVKLREPFAESLAILNETITNAFPQDKINFSRVDERIADKYFTTRRFRDLAGAAFVAILFITLMGLIGYINDEVQRHSKEIAIRKVNGAERWSILLLLNRQVLWLAIPAITLGTVASYFIGAEWITQFSVDLLELSVPLYLSIALIILVVIVTCVIMKAWKIANENPVISIKNE